MPRAPRLALLCLATAMVAGLATPASADSASHKLRRAKAHAAALDARAHRQAVQIKAAQAKLAVLDAQANTALAQLQVASENAAKADAAKAAAQTVLDAATAQTDAARLMLNNLAANAYRSQAAGGDVAATLALVGSGDPTSLIEGLNLLDQVGKTQSNAVEDLKLAEARQQRAEEVSAQAA